MRFLAALALLAAGCFDSNPPENLLCGPHDACPSGMSCDRFAATPVCRRAGSDAGVRPPPNFGPGGPPEMVTLPAGTFQMGCNPLVGNRMCGDNEQPEHAVTLRSFQLTRTEITQAQYAACVDDNSTCRASFGFDRSKPQNPIGAITYDDARTYCSWAGMRLPTEAEWEYAAKDMRDTWEFPWGVTPGADCDRANIMGCGGVKAVGSLPSGATSLGIVDLAGNVAEWCNDWYQPTYDTDGDDPRGPPSGNFRVKRGGSIVSDAKGVRSAARDNAAPESQQSSVGIRCAK